MNEKNFLNNREYICAYCLNKNEDNLCDDYYQCCDEMNKLKNAYSDYLEKQIEQLQQENQQLKKDCEKESYVVDKLTRQLTQEYKNTNNVTHQLKQRDEVIDEANKLILDYICTEEYCSLDVPLIADFFMKLQQILQKYKGDNK